MSDEIKIPEATLAAAVYAARRSVTDATTDCFGFDAASRVIARWMREECAKVACCPGHAMAEAIHAAILKVGTK